MGSPRAEMQAIRNSYPVADLGPTGQGTGLWKTSSIRARVP